MIKPKSEILRTARSRQNSAELTDLKRVQQELERAFSLLNATLESIADGIVVVDLAGNTITFNQKYIEMWNLPDSLVVSKNTTERVVFLAEQVKDSAGFLKRVEELANQPEAEGYDIIELKDGRVFERHSKPQWLGEKVVGRVWNFRDITEQRQTTETLQQREKQYRNLVEALQDLIWSMDAEGRWTFVNQAAKQIYGYEPEEMLGRPFTDFETPAQIQKDMKIFQRILASESFFPYETEHIRKDGTQVNLSFNAIVLRDDERNVLGITGTATNITERKWAEEALRQNGAIMAAAQRIAHVGNWVTDIPTNRLYWSDEIYRIFGLAPQEFSATVDAFFSRVHPDDLEYVLKAVDDAIAGRKGYNVDHRIIQSGGEVRFVHQEAEVTYDEMGKPLRFIGIVQDVTERVKLEQQVRESLERRSRQVQLSSQVAHEVAMATNLEDLYQRVVAQLEEQFGYYHVQLLSYNPVVDALVLVAGSGDIGLRMMEARYQRPVGTDLIGITVGTSASMLRADVSTDPDWHVHPLLPETRGELALPIKLGRENAQAQLTALKSFINNGFAGFIVTAIDPVAVAQVAKEALTKGMRVVTQTSDLGAQNQTTLVRAVEYDMGYMLGRQAGEWAKKHLSPGQILKLGVLNYRLIPQIIQREEGIIAGIKAVFGPTIEIVGNETAADPLQSRPIAEAWLQAQPDLSMIVGVNDANALGAYRAVIAAGKNDADTFFVGGIDAVPEALAAIKAGGAYQATVDQQPKLMGTLTMRALVASIKGQPYDPVYSVQCTPINPSNVDDFLSTSTRLAPLQTETAVEEGLAGLDLRGLKIGLSVLTLTNPFFVALVEGAKEEADRLGIELVVNDPKQVWGVLDVQSDVAGLLNVEDQLALEGLCAQIAAAIESTRLRQEMEDRLRELNTLQRLMSREGWQAFQATRQQTAQAYLFDQTSVRATTVDELGLLHNGTAQNELLASATAVSNGHIVTRPMAVQGEIIGALGIQDDAGDPLSPEDQAFLAAVAQQVAEALERARLLEQTQKRAAGLEAVAQVSAVTSTTLETQKLLQTAVDLTKTNFGLYHAHIYLLDEAGENLTLAVGAGEVGQQMVAQGWQIPLNHKHSLVAQAAHTRQSVMVNDVHESPDFLPNPSLPETRSEVAIPMIAGDRLLGVLDVQADEVNHFTEEDVQVKTVLATQIATALHNASLYQQTQAALAETESLYTASHRLSAAGDLQEALAAVVEEMHVPGINRALLATFAYNSAGEIETVIIAANWHSGEGTLPTPVDTGYSRESFSFISLIFSSEPIFCNDVQQDERVDSVSLATFQRQNIRALAILPLRRVGSRQLGVLALEAEEKHEFTEREIQPYLSLAAQLAIAVDNHRLLDETRVALAEVEQTQRRYTVQAWETYRIKNKVLSHEQVREGVTPLAENLLPEISQTLAQKRPQTADSRPQLIDGGRWSAVSGQLLVPLTVRGETIGVLGLQETDELRAWSPEEITLIEAIADQLAQAAENIRLIDETQQRAAREKRVNEISEKIQATQSLEEALQVAVKEVGLSLQASQTIIQLEVK